MTRLTHKNLRSSLPALIAGAVLLAGANVSQAQVLIELPPPPNNASNIAVTQFNAVAFTLNSNFSNILIEASLVSATAGNTGTAYLTTAVGTGTTAADLVSSTSFNFTQVANPSTDLGYVSLFSGLALPADDYFLVFGDPITGTGGSISLNSTASYVTDPGASVGSMMFAGGANLNSAFPPASNFGTSGLGNRFIRVTQVPEPASFVLAGFAAIGLLRRRRA